MRTTITIAAAALLFGLTSPGDAWAQSPTGASAAAPAGAAAAAADQAAPKAPAKKPVVAKAKAPAAAEQPKLPPDVITPAKEMADAPKGAKGRCTRLAFSVNDYGKDGPTKDALRLLDGYIANWAAKNNVKKYTVGKKSVSCELFLDFGVFDEHTCKASAPVCW